MKHFLKSSLFFICLSVTVGVNAGVQGIVTANNLNVRVKPSTNYAVVAKLKKNDKVFVINHKKEWYEISAPNGTKVFVSSSFLKDGKIVKTVNLRSGPSVAFSAFRTAQPEESIKIIDDKTNPDWIQIEPENPVSAWVSAKYIFITPENIVELEKQLKEESAPAEVISDAITESTIEDITGIKMNDDSDLKPVQQEEVIKSVKTVKKDEPLPFTDSIPKQVSIAGIMVRCKDEKGYVEYALASRVNGKLFPLCYLHADIDKNIGQFLGQRVVASGMQRWVKDWERPVVEVKEVKKAEF